MSGITEPYIVLTLLLRERNVQKECGGEELPDFCRAVCRDCRTRGFGALIGELRAVNVEGIQRITIPAPFASGTTNTYFAEKPVPTLIDVPANEEKYYERLKKELKTRGYSVSKDISRIIVTHPHFDHCGLAGRIASETDAEVWTYGGGARYLENFPDETIQDFQYYRTLLESAGVPARVSDCLESLREALVQQGSRVRVSRYLTDGDAIELGSMSFKVVHVPGHTPWCFLLHDRERRVALTGDFLIRDISSNAVLQRPREGAKGYKSLKSYVASLRKAQALDLKEAFPGHGDLVRNAGERIEGLLSSIGARRSQILSVVTARGICSPFEIMQSLFLNLPDWQVLLGISEVIGHLELLEEEGLVRRAAGSSLAFFSCNSRPGREIR